jgi:Subtilase family/Peptidase inhibitor I9
MHSRHVRAVIVAALVVAGSTVVPVSRSAPVRAAAPPSGPYQPVIVLLRDQHDAVPATPAGAGHRKALTDADQRPLVDHAVKAGARDVKRFSIINGFAAAMSPAERERLASDSRVRAVVPDVVVKKRPATQAAATGGAPPTAAASTGICPSDPARPLLEPEALQLTHAAFDDPAVPQAQQIATGRGVKVAFVADGLDVRNPDLIRPDGSPVVVDFQDFTGSGFDAPSDGTEAFGDASAIAAQGRQRYDLSSFVNPASPLPPGCNIRIRGMAPGASLVALNVTGGTGGSFATIVQGIDYAVNVARVQVINESLGDNPIADRHDDPVSLANHAAVAAGVTVVAASGDAGPANTVGNPAGDPQVISVGASTSFRVVAQTQRNIPGFRDGWTSDNVSAISSGGVTEGATVDDLVAPGDEGWALCSTDTARFTGCLNGRGQPSPIQVFAGTSQASPFTAGAAALVIEAYAATHYGARPSPALVKRFLTSTAADQNDPADRQGAGLLDALSAVRAAQSEQDVNGAPAPRGDTLLVQPGQLSATANPGTQRSLPLTVTNTGQRQQTVSARGRLLSKVVSDQRGSVQLDATSPATPTWASGFGSVFAFVTRTITVPAGADHLDASIAFSPPDEQVTLRLLDPGGGFVARTDFEGPSGFGHLDVHAPVPGTWTAIFDSPASPTGFKGAVHFDFLSSANTSFGTVVPSALTLEPGQTGAFLVVVRTPDQPGDLVAAVQLDASSGRRLAVPLTLRSLIPTAGGQGTFTGTLTGGNGRSGVGAPAQTTNYRFDVPAGLRDFGIGLTLGGDPHQALIGFLIAPNGQVLSQQTNVTAVDVNGGPTAFSQSLQEFRRDPQPGRWTFVLKVLNPVAGTTTAQQFAGTLRFNVVDTAASGLPASPATVLRPGVPVTARVTVRNNGVAPENYFVDPRSTARADLRLVPSFGEPETGLGLPAQSHVDYLVPPEADRVTATARATAPIDLELESVSLEPDVIARSGVGNAAATSIRATEVGPGQYFTTAALVGPFPPGGAMATVDMATFAHAQAFDGTVTSSTGDRWLATVQQTPPPFTPLVLQPGETGTITVTIRPSGPAGTVVRGVLYVEDFNEFPLTGDELKAFPYTYTIG